MTPTTAPDPGQTILDATDGDGGEGVPSDVLSYNKPDSPRCRYHPSHAPTRCPPGGHEPSSLFQPTLDNMQRLDLSATGNKPYHFWVKLERDFVSSWASELSGDWVFFFPSSGLFCILYTTLRPCYFFVSLFACERGKFAEEAEVPRQQSRDSFLPSHGRTTLHIFFSLRPRQIVVMHTSEQFQLCLITHACRIYGKKKTPSPVG